MSLPPPGPPPPLPPPAAGTPPSEPPRRRSRVWLAFLVQAVLMAGVATGVASSRRRSSPPQSTIPVTLARVVSPATTGSSLRQVRYRTEGTARYGSITYATPSGTGQSSDVDVPLTLKDGTVGLSFTMRPGAFLYLSIQNGTDSGSVTCIIEVNGVVVARNTGSGAYAIASCDATA